MTSATMPASPGLWRNQEWLSSLMIQVLRGPHHWNLTAVRDPGVPEEEFGGSTLGGEWVIAFPQESVRES